MVKHLIYALKNDELVHISEVERGLKCGCICPACKMALNAKKGEKNAHHFAHKSSQECKYGYETSLHMAAKEILSKAGKMILPESWITFPELMHDPIQACKIKKITIEHVELERRFGSVIPDVIIYTDDKPLFIEIFVTHRIDNEKLEKLKELGIPTIEIDLSNIDDNISHEALSDIILGKSELKYWKYDPIVEPYKQRFIDAADKLRMERVFGEDRVECPCSGSYRDFFNYCRYCESCVGVHALGNMFNPDRYVLCTDRQNVVEIEDLDRPDLEPGRDYTKIIKENPTPKPAVKVPSFKPVKPELVEFESLDEGSKRNHTMNAFHQAQLESLYRQMEREKAEKERNNLSQGHDKPTSVGATSVNPVIETAVNILSKANTIICPSDESWEAVITDVKLGCEIDGYTFNIVFYIDGMPTGIMFFTGNKTPEITGEPNLAVLGIDLSDANKYVTVKSFMYDLLGTVKMKQWLYP